ncbi:SurA N-terminal domain-containing protein [Streptomyces sp. HNM0574]|uniref:SurA N-terminal domain-containing protein n=1 Tax=Streptomyces sp. HNM0574 TaxID=2714954 RepID=UPI00146BA50B|nr:SurA N-terminal domain-containing protein [Streptomyces sp. HNM0574]NLU70881.1 hypothetical protein [Streptomyces sp. HNM0574]
MHSRRRRSALAVSAALLVGAPLLTACGQEAHPGAAAVMKGDRISTGALQGRVEAVRTAQRSAPQSEQMISGSGQLTRAKLDGMLRDRIVAKAAEDAKVSVSRGEIQRTRAELAKQAGGREQLEVMLLQQQGVAPDEIDDRIRMQLAVDKIARKAGIDPRSPQGNAQLNAELAKTSEAMGIDVNPRFGTWDAKKATLSSTTEPWLQDLSAKQADRAAQQQQGAIPQ